MPRQIVWVFLRIFYFVLLSYYIEGKSIQQQYLESTMNDLSQTVYDRIKLQNIDSEVEKKHINQILTSLNSEGRSVTEIARLAQVPPWMGRIVLNTAESVEGSHISNERMRFKRDSEANSNTVEEKAPQNQPREAASPAKPVGKKSSLASVISKIIPSIIRILHERPQTVSSLADEMEIEQEECLKIIKKLESENAVTEDLSTEWPEPVYMLDEEGYKGYITRVEEKAKTKTEVEKAKPTEKVVTKESKPSKPSKPSNKSNQSTSVSDMVLEIIKAEGKVKVSELVSKTNTAITRIDIEKAIEVLLNNNSIVCDNPSKRHPLYSIAGENNKKIENTTALTAKKAQKTESTEKAEANTVEQKEAEKANTSVVSEKRPASQSSPEKKISQEDDYVVSEFSDIAALELVLEDVLPQLSDAKVRQIKRAIKGIENEKNKVRNAVSNLSKTINELM